ncbi:MULTISPECIES: S16 family serine protease [Thermocrispum]|jgi:PDZ domain-containing protein|uniref:endopeptidase La n=1 Tax=Thermocrispum agreste TaxID=37925 RepID=A0ABD6FDI6_9PSEU|nr:MULTISPECIES: S16 family serine protease [Thermocrispum]
MVIVLVFGLVGTFVRVPYVALGPGPTHDTLAETEDGPLIAISGSKTYETSGELRLTTVAVQDGVTLLGALGLWASGSYALAPRELYFPPGETDEEVKQKNAQQFVDSQDAAVSAALAYLKESGAAVGKRIRYTVVVQEVTREEAARVLDPGDELVEVNGRKVSTPQDVLDALKGTKPNEKITVTFREADAEAGEKAGGEGAGRGGTGKDTSEQNKGRGADEAERGAGKADADADAKDGTKDKAKASETQAERTRTATITLGKADDGRSEGLLGVVVGARPELPGLSVDIKLADVGGPSAGTMFALAIVDRLTPGELTGGRRVAGTGEITPDGTIGPIGGVSFKLAAARDDGATVFLVPAENCAEAAKSAPDGLRLVKVSKLAEAVQALENLDKGLPVPSC